MKDESIKLYFRVKSKKVATTLCHAAQIAGADYLLTEDLQAGQDLEGVLVVDPFQTEPEKLL